MNNNDIITLKLNGKTLEQIAKMKKMPYRKIRNKLYYSPLREEFMAKKQKREKDVINLKREGKTIKQIARKMKLTQDQVKHILYRKSAERNGKE
ncbi:MAG: helix-turn-helix transcriptional regulator [Gammaproteobacteria bacterium]